MTSVKVQPRKTEFRAWEKKPEVRVGLDSVGDNGSISMLTGIISVVIIMFLSRNPPNTVRYVCRSQEQRENVTCVTLRRDKWGSGGVLRARPGNVWWLWWIECARDSVNAGSPMGSESGPAPSPLYLATCAESLTASTSESP